MNSYAGRRLGVFRQVVVLEETSPGEAAELVEALISAPTTPSANALNHLMEDAPPSILGGARELTGSVPGPGVHST
ncbi:MAG: hypothetical protein ACO33A_06060 [Hyphomonas sp.]